MNLNNEHRTEFAKDVVKDIPRKQTMDRKTFVAAVEALLYDALPAELKEWKKKEPRAFHVHGRSVKARRLKDNGVEYEERYHDFISCQSILVDDNDFDSATPNASALKIREQIDALLEQYHAHLDETIERNQLRYELEAKAQGARTLKQLQALFPQLLEFMPQEKKYAVAVFEEDKATLAKLKKAGLKVPKGAKK